MLYRVVQYGLADALSAALLFMRRDVCIKKIGYDIAKHLCPVTLLATLMCTLCTVFACHRVPEHNRLAIQGVF